MPKEHMEAVAEAVHLAAVPISVAIDTMLAALPAGTDPAQVASDLMYSVALMSDHPEFIAILTEGLAARQALIELAIKV